MRRAFLTGLAGMLLAVPAFTASAQSNDVDEQIDQLQQQIRELEQRLEETEQKAESAEESASSAESGQQIDVGGAVRFQYAYRRYDANSRDTDGELELDTIRLNFDGEIGNVLLSAEYRFYEYMDVVHHAWFGYEFSDDARMEVGVTQVPFGITPYSSHNFFFSSNYYLGLEDDYDFGIKTKLTPGNWDFRLAYFANDEIRSGGDTERYSYDIIADTPDGQTDGDPNNGFEGNDIEEDNTFNARVAYNFSHGPDSNSEFGISAQYGSLHNDTAGTDAGSHKAGAVHLNGDYGPWNVMLQAARQDYELRSGREQLASGAYAFTYGFPAEASSYLANVAYDLPVDIGPITNLRFYNDFTYVTDKPADLPATWMNVLGMAVSAGGLFTYVDLVRAENQPFIGGDLLGDGGPETRFNINFGYYF